MKYSRSGEYQLSKAVIITNTNNPVELDIAPSFVDAAIYESIFEHGMSGNISIIDTNNIRQKYALGFGETVLLEWATAGLDDTISVTGTVYDISEPSQVNDHTSGFTLHFASPEVVNAKSNRIFSGYNTTCDGIVQAIFDKIKRDVPFKAKSLDATPTRNIENFLFTGQQAVTSIQMVVDRAISSSGKMGYLFFENNQQFKFTPIEDLYAQEPIIEYRYSSSAAYTDANNIQEESFNTFQDFQIDAPNKHMNDVDDGQHGSSWGYLSILDKSLTVVNYNAQEDFDKVNSLGNTPNAIADIANPDYSDKLSMQYVNVREQNEGAIVKNRMKLLKSSTANVNIGTFGASFIKVGDVCTATIPAFSSEDFKSESVDTASGKFLIVEIKHVLTGKMYNQRIRLMKDSFEEQIA